jgi:hypothetical protein
VLVPQRNLIAQSGLQGPDRATSEWLADFERRARARLDAPDAWAALRDLIGESAFRKAADRTLSAAVAAGIASEPLAEARRRVWAAVQELVDRAKAQGTRRADATTAASASSGPARRPARRRRRRRPRRVAPLRRARARRAPGLTGEPAHRARD